MREKLSPESAYNEYEWKLEKEKLNNRHTLLISIKGNAIHGDTVTLRFILFPRKIRIAIGH